MRSHHNTLVEQNHPVTRLQIIYILVTRHWNICQKLLSFGWLLRLPQGSASDTLRVRLSATPKSLLFVSHQAKTQRELHPSTEIIGQWMTETTWATIPSEWQLWLRHGLTQGIWDYLWLLERRAPHPRCSLGAQSY